MKNHFLMLILAMLLHTAASAQPSTLTPTPDCQKVFIWPVKVENARAEGAKGDVKRFVEAALKRINGCTLLDRDRIGTLDEIARTEQDLQHLNNASKKVKTALKTAKAEQVIFVSIEKAADGRLTLNMSLEAIETTEMLHTDTWNLTAEESQESNLKESIYSKVFELVHRGIKPPEAPGLFDKIQNAKNDKKRIPHLCNYLNAGYKAQAPRAEKWLDNIMYEELKKSKREWWFAAGGLLVGSGLFVWGQDFDTRSQALYDTYKSNTDQFDEIYAETSRDDLFDQANTKRGTAIGMKIGGTAVFLAGAFFLGKRLSWQKTLKQGKKTLGLSFVPSASVQGMAFAPPMKASFRIQF